MGGSLSGRYEGEGPNVSGSQATTPPGDVPVSNLTSSATGPIGPVQDVAIDRRRRLRISSEAGRQAIAINYSSADHQFANATRWIYIGTTGNLAVRFADDTADVTLSNLPVGLYQFAISIVRKTGSTAAGVAIF